MLEAQHQQQQAQVEMQDVELGGLAESVDRLGVMGRSMNDELRAQGKAFDQFTQEVDETRDKMRFAVNAMNKMMRKKDNGKLCTIFILSIVLFLLAYFAFS